MQKNGIYVKVYIDVFCNVVGVSLELGDGEDELVDTDEENTDPFHPTREWQTVKKGTGKK